MVDLLFIALFEIVDFRHLSGVGGFGKPIKQRLVRGQR